MPESTDTDRLLRLQSALSLRRHEGIRNALKWFQENPKELTNRTKEFDSVLYSLKFDESLNRVSTLAGLNTLDNVRHVHAKKLENMLNGKNLPPSLGQMATISKGENKKDILKTIGDTFTRVNNLLSDEWSWATKLNPEQTASGLLIEGFGLMAEDSLGIPDLRRAFVEAFEEELILNHKDSPLLKDVIGWMEEEKESFSPAVQKEIDSTLLST